MGGAEIIMAAGSEIDITDDGRIAVLRMQCRDNRFTLEFINNLNSALDEVERYYVPNFLCLIEVIVHIAIRPLSL